MKNPKNRFRSGSKSAGLPLGPEILAKSQLIWKKIEEVKPWGKVLISEGSDGRKVENFGKSQFN